MRNYVLYTPLKEVPYRESIRLSPEAIGFYHPKSGWRPASDIDKSRTLQEITCSGTVIGDVEDYDLVDQLCDVLESGQSILGTSIFRVDFRALPCVEKSVVMDEEEEPPVEAPGLSYWTVFTCAAMPTDYCPSTPRDVGLHRAEITNGIHTLQFAERIGFPFSPRQVQDLEAYVIRGQSRSTDTDQEAD